MFTDQLAYTVQPERWSRLAHKVTYPFSNPFLDVILRSNMLVNVAAHSSHLALDLSSRH